MGAHSSQYSLMQGHTLSYSVSWPLFDKSPSQLLELYLDRINHSFLAFFFQEERQQQFKTSRFHQKNSSINSRLVSSSVLKTSFMNLICSFCQNLFFSGSNRYQVLLVLLNPFLYRDWLKLPDNNNSSSKSRLGLLLREG